MISQIGEEVKGIIQFPCHESEKVIAFKSSKGRSSNKCPRCGKFAIFDFDHMTAVPVSAARGVVHRAKLNQRVSTEP